MTARTAATALVALLALSTLAPAQADDLTFTPVADLDWTGGTELAYDGRYVYAGQMDGVDNRGQRPDQGGVFVVDTEPRDADGTIREVPEVVGFLPCAGNDIYVVLARPGLLAVGAHKSDCNPATGGHGVAFVDVTDPANPTVISGVATGYSHSLTVHPTEPVLYVNGGGVYAEDSTVVDFTDPTQPTVVSSYTNSVPGCHDSDLLVGAEHQLLFCAGLTEVSVMDIADPRAPVTVSRIANPAIQFPHNALPSPDGELLVINDEAFAAHECVTEAGVVGGIWLYDISGDPTTPLLAGFISPPQGAEPLGTDVGWTPSWCTAHNYNFIPGTRLLVSSWFSGGTRVHDLSDPLNPVELYHFQPEDTVAYTAHFYGGRIYTNDMHRGMDVIDVDGLEQVAASAADDDAVAPAPAGVLPALPTVLPHTAASAATRTLVDSPICIIPRLRHL